MRNEKEMMELIINAAKENERNLDISVSYSDTNYENLRYYFLIKF